MLHLDHDSEFFHKSIKRVTNNVRCWFLIKYIKRQYNMSQILTQVSVSIAIIFTLSIKTVDNEL